jgi:biopolymer transport protein ExbB
MWKKLTIGILSINLIFGIYAYRVSQVHAACGNGYSYCNTITTVHSLAGTADTSNFPMLFSTSTMSSLATVANSGKIQNTATQTGGGYAITVPADLIFTSDSACGTKLNWEIESYTASSGSIVAWINIGTLSHTADVTIYMCYGNSSVTTWQGNVNSTWDTNFKSVWHMAANTSTNTVDSTSNANNAASNTGVTDTTGQVDGGANMIPGGTRKYMVMSNVNSFSSSQAHTYEAWIYKTADVGGSYGWIIGGSAAAGDGTDMTVGDNGTDKLQFWTGGGNNVYNSSGTISLNAWHYLTLVADGANHISFYIDGSFDSTQTIGAWSGGGSLVNYIGNWSEAQSYGYAGNLDELRISNTNRSASYITATYNNENSPNTFYVVGAQQSGTVAASPNLMSIQNATLQLKNSTTTIKGQ